MRIKGKKYRNIVYEKEGGGGGHWLRRLQIPIKFQDDSFHYISPQFEC